MIELKVFVRESLLQVAEGVKEAQVQQADRGGARVNPAGFLPGTDIRAKTFYPNTGPGSATMVDFDIAVTVAEQVGSEVKIGVVAAVFGAGASGDLRHQASTVSRLRFAVPILLPPS